MNNIHHLGNGFHQVMKQNNPLLSTQLENQRRRLHNYLRKQPITTLEARSKLDILMPAARIYELRHYEGLNIQLHWINEKSDSGIWHRVGVYVLHPGKYKDNKKTAIKKQGGYHDQSNQ